MGLPLKVNELVKAIKDAGAAAAAAAPAGATTPSTAATSPSQLVTFTGYPVYRIGHWYEGGRNPYYVENVKQAFGEPGRFYLDRPTGTLTYTPLPGETLESCDVIAPRLTQLVRCAG